MKLHKLASMFASTSIALSAFADDHGGDSPDYLSPFNVIGTKADIADLEGSGTVLNSDDLGTFMYTDINDILRQVPGVYVRPETGYGFFPNISIRGNDPHRSKKITILEDGVPSAPAPFASPASYYAPTAGRMAGFEILKGSSQLKYGPNTTGGVLNYLSTPIPEQQKSYIRASYGDYSEIVSHAYSGGKIDFAGGRLGYLVELFDHRSDGWKTLNLAPLNMADRSMPISKTDLNFKISYELENHYLEFKYGNTFMDSDVSYQGETDLAVFNSNPYHVPYVAAWDNMDSHQHRYYLRHIANVSDAVSLTSTLFHNEFNRDWYKMKQKSSVDSTGASDYSWVNKHNNRNYKVTGFQTNLDFEIGSNNFDLGFRVMSEDYIQNPYTEDKYSYESDGNATHLARSVVLSQNKAVLDGVDPYEHSDSVEVYLTDQITIGDLTVTPGVRFTSVEYQYTDDPKKTLDDVLVGIGSNYRVTDNISIFGGVHQGHAMPGAGAAKETYIDSNGDGTKDKLIQEPKSIEESLSFEIGARGGFGNFGYEITYFSTDYENLLAGESLAAGVNETYNIGDASVDGVELMLATDFGSDTGLGLPISLSATFTKNEFDKITGAPQDGDGGYYEGAAVGNSFPYIPDTKINFNIGLVSESVRTYLNYSYQDQVFTSAANTDKLEGYGILDWSGFYEVKEGVTAFAKVTNLTDKDYAHAAHPAGYRPGAPRIWSLGMEFDF